MGMTGVGIGLQILHIQGAFLNLSLSELVPERGEAKA